MQNISTGVELSSVPVAVNPSAPAKWPSWNTNAIAPNVADRLSRFSTMALIGTSTLPVIRNSTTKVTSAINPAASGTRPKMADFESTSWAEGPATSVSNGAGVARTSRTSRSPADEIGSTEGTTESHVPFVVPPVNLAEAGPGGATKDPPMYEPVSASTRATPVIFDSAMAYPST